MRSTHRGDDLYRHGACRHGGGSDGARADCSRASGGAPACGQPGCRDRPEAERRPGGSPRHPRAVGSRSASITQARSACTSTKNCGLRSLTQCRRLLRRAGLGRPSLCRTRSGSCPSAAQTFRSRRPRGVPVRDGGTHRLDLRRPKGPNISESWPPAVPPGWSSCSDPLHGPRSMLLPEAGSPSTSLDRGYVDFARLYRCLTPLLKPEGLLRPTGVTEVEHRCSSRLFGAERTSRSTRHRPFADQDHRACWQSLASGDTRQDYPEASAAHLPQALQQQLSSQKYRSSSLVLLGHFDQANSVSKEIRSDSPSARSERCRDRRGAGLQYGVELFLGSAHRSRQLFL